MVLTEQLTVGEAAAASLEAVRILEQNGIDYCCGGKRELGEVCREQGVDFSALSRELERAAQEKRPEDKDWKTVPLRDLIRHIVSTHHEYLKLELPLLNVRLKKSAGRPR
jgi:regulator of cell morphogenesis and NO signaling